MKDLPPDVPNETPGDAPGRKRDLADIAGAWKDDPEFDSAILDQDQIDVDLWK